MAASPCRAIACSTGASCQPLRHQKRLGTYQAVFNAPDICQPIYALCTSLSQTHCQTWLHLTASFAASTIAQAHRFVKSGRQAHGGDEGIRTPDLLRAREALSQLSYIPSGPSVKWSIGQEKASSNRLTIRPRTIRPLDQWAILDLNQRPFPYQRNALAD